ncbi:sulfite exporter TauE/SafE family protein [Maritimibacter alkaliphilus]|uniref:sulfite exporter TauE/SafE family protein n=1 Tax=Maritimibacter alkaliphilus TaxID=404236 RepID=UPI001C98254B|nr:sulfite exporter TauE/SafE family protein [Maritimibacter alkaliphilus]MBY6092668.1 sulfite exporter TauE/SafE family protein [Maritimibacter alkaliphilus]
MQPLELAVVAGVVCAGAVLQSFTGFGFALIVAPIAALVAPDLVPGPLLALTLLLTLSYTWQTRALIDWRDFGFIMLGRLPLTLVAGYAISRVDPVLMSLVFGLFLLGAVAVTWSRVSLSPTPAVLTIAGGLSGFFGTLTAVGAPPLAIAYQNRGGPQIRATLGANIILGTIVSLAALGLGGRIDWGPLGWQTAAALPFVLGGSWIGRRLADRVDEELFRRIVLLVCAVSSSAVVIAALLQL